MICENEITILERRPILLYCSPAQVLNSRRVHGTICIVQRLHRHDSRNANPKTAETRSISFLCVSKSAVIYIFLLILFSLREPDTPFCLPSGRACERAHITYYYIGRYVLHFVNKNSLPMFP